MPEPTFEWVDIDLIRPNKWNPNAMDDEMYAKAIESIHEFGFVDPVTVRTELDIADALFYELIDGEHRWKAGQDHGNCVRGKKRGEWERHRGLAKLPITNLGVVTDDVAQQLTIVLNETRGTYDPKKMGELLVDLATVKPIADLVAVLPFDKPKFEELAALPTIDWGAVTPRRSSQPKGQGERWVERVYRLPAGAAETLDQAIRRVHEDDGSPDWQALQTIANHFLRS